MHHVHVYVYFNLTYIVIVSMTSQEHVLFVISYLFYLHYCCSILYRIPCYTLIEYNLFYNNDTLLTLFGLFNKTSYDVIHTDMAFVYLCVRCHTLLLSVSFNNINIIASNYYIHIRIVEQLYIWLLVKVMQKSSVCFLTEEPAQRLRIM